MSYFSQSLHDKETNQLITGNKMNLAQLNELTIDEATHTFMQCCTSAAWVEKMVQARPFADKNVDTLRAKYANTKELASGEQSSVSEATEQVIESLAQGNADYLEKFGFIFIVCATGKSAAQMVALLQARLPNDKVTELTNAAEEQRKIFHLRLEKLI